MVFVGLVITSFGFFIPAYIAFIRRRKKDAFRAGLLAVSSIAYHGTVHPLAHAIDACIAHGCGVIYFKETLDRIVIHKYFGDIVGLAGLTSAGFIYLFKSKFNPHPSNSYWHLGLHILAQATWCFHILV